MTQGFDPIGPGLPLVGQLFDNLGMFGGQIAAFEAVGSQVEQLFTRVGQGP